MTSIEHKAGDFVIDAALLADAFRLSQDEIKTRMRNGTITSRCDAGVDEDAGRWRLTFHHGNRACRFIIDEEGAVLQKATFPIRPRQRNPAARLRDIGTMPHGEGQDP
ncbi:DUF6522 family protein [Oricola nitratireducens]|uniref:DUF6522 family protein n=1 Tax=Oricola nitratireducens TaxID=2775868 RepID=UPI00186887C4|nr:DUF6522 family protein [Oricola nitratireducens]